MYSTIDKDDIKLLLQDMLSTQYINLTKYDLEYILNLLDSEYDYSLNRMEFNEFIHDITDKVNFK